MAADKVEFIEFVNSTGDTTDRALYRISEGEDWLFSVAVGLSGSIVATLATSDTEIYRLLPEYGRRYVERHLASNPGWEAANLGKTDAYLDVTSSMFDRSDFFASPPTA